MFLALGGAPDERGFWPVLLAALALGLALAKDRRAFSDIAVGGMSQPIVLLMVMAWMLAGVLGKVVQASGFVIALAELAHGLGVTGGGFTAAAFLIACVISTATGTSLGTLIVTTPLLHPAGTDLGSDPVVLLGALVGGAVFGDNISPVSDTTIASAATQDAGMGQVVKSRLRYALPAAAIALVLYTVFGGGYETAVASTESLQGGNSRALAMLVAPALVIFLLLRRRHLIEGLMAGIGAAVVIGLGLRLVDPSTLLYVDPERFSARGLIIEGIEKSIGTVVFTFFLMGIIATFEASGLLGTFLERWSPKESVPATEGWIFGVTSVAALATTHSSVVILALGDMVREAGERVGIDRYRRSNLLDVTVCTYPFLLPYCIPTILAASLTAEPVRVTALQAGLHNFHSWALLGVIVFAIVTGYGRAREGNNES